LITYQTKPGLLDHDSEGPFVEKSETRNPLSHEPEARARCINRALALRSSGMVSMPKISWRIGLRPASSASGLAISLRVNAGSLSYRAGDFIFRDGDTAGFMYIVLKGSVEMSTRDKVVVTIPEGKPCRLMRATEKGKAYGPITAKAYAVLSALLIGFHNNESGRCFPSYDRICEAAGCCRQTVARAGQACKAPGLARRENELPPFCGI
jgi:hypothetical protein